MRDLADALHTLGHMEEEDGRLEAALALHRESLRLFEASGYPTEESWDDGVNHAQEHIFMDLFDLGTQKNDPEVLDQAYQWTEDTGLANSKASLSNRFQPRYVDLVKGRKAKRLKLSKVAAEYVSRLCDFLLNDGIIMIDLFSRYRR